MNEPSRLFSHSVGSSSLAGVRSFVILISSFSLRRPLEESLYGDWIQTGVKVTAKMLYVLSISIPFNLIMTGNTT